METVGSSEDVELIQDGAPTEPFIVFVNEQSLPGTFSILAFPATHNPNKVIAAPLRLCLVEVEQFNRILRRGQEILIKQGVFKVKLTVAGV